MWLASKAKKWAQSEFGSSYELEKKFISGDSEAVKEMFDKFKDPKNKEFCEKFLQNVTPQMSQDQIENVAKKLYQLEEQEKGQGNVRGSGHKSTLAGVFAGHHLKNHLDNLDSSDDFIVRALSDAKKEYDTFTKLEDAYNKNPASTGQRPKAIPVPLTLTGKDLEKLIEPMYDFLKRAVGEKGSIPDETRAKNLARLLDFHLIKDYLMEKNNDMKIMPHEQLSRIPFVITPDVTTKLFDAYKEVEKTRIKQDRQVKFTSVPDANAPTNSDEPLRPPPTPRRP